MLTKVIRVDTLGVAGSAVGSVTVGVPPCKLEGIQVQYDGAMPGSTVVMVTKCLAGLEQVVLTLDATNSDVPLTALAEHMLDDDGSVLPIVVPPRLNGELRVDVTDGDEMPDAVIITLLLGPGDWVGVVPEPPA